MPNLIGNLELEPFSTSEVIWQKEDLKLLGSETGPATIVRALKAGQLSSGEPYLFGSLEELIAEADAHFHKVAQLTGTTVITRHSLGVATLPKEGLTAYERFVLRNPYLNSGEALVAKVDVVKKLGRIPVTDMNRIIKGANRYLHHDTSKYVWGDITKGEINTPPFAVHDQFTYGYTTTVESDTIFLTDIDPIVFER